MKLLLQVTNKTIAININEILRLASVPEDKENNNVNSPNSTITDNSTITNSNAPSKVIGQLPLDSGNTTTILPGELPNNNINQQEIKEEKQKEVSPSFSAIDLAMEVEDYLKSPSKFFYGHNQALVAKLYERFRVEISDNKVTSIKVFQTVLYYHLLKITNSNNVQGLNQLLSKSKFTLSLTEILNSIQLIVKNKEVHADYKKEVFAVSDNPTTESNTD